MAAVMEREDQRAMLDSEANALEKMIAARCEQIERFVSEILSRGDPWSREADLQFLAFEERRTMALRELDDPCEVPLDVRIGRLEQLRNALDCSWEFFREAGAASGKDRTAASDDRNI